METCECEYDPILGAHYELVGGNIIYCPMHAAAYDAIESLKGLAELSGDGRMYCWCQHVDTVEHTDACTLARHVIESLDKQ